MDDAILQELTAMINAAYRANDSMVFGRQSTRLKEGPKELLDTIANGICFCMRDSEKYMGTITIVPDEAKSLASPSTKFWTLRMFALHLDYRGKGISPQLLEIAESYIRDHADDRKSILLLDTVEPVGMVPYYRRRGFRETATEHMPKGTWGSLMSFNLVLMEKEVV
jgi:GNAT superfamily N-acetyltransferase